MDGASHQGELAIPLDRILPSNLLILTGFISFLVLISLLWKDISGSTTGKWWRFFPRQTIVIDAETKPQSWKSMIQQIRRQRTLFTITANFHNSTQRQETKTGTRAQELPITLCKSKNDVNYTSVDQVTLQNFCSQSLLLENDNFQMIRMLQLLW